jgi:hypothetical protein
MHFFGILATNLNTVAATDTSFWDNLSLSIGYFNGFGRTFPNAGVTGPAFILDGVNQWFIFSALHPFPYASLFQHFSFYIVSVK